LKDWIPIPGTVTGRLVEAATDLFAAYGCEQVSVQQIAKQAELTTGAIYHHFGSKRQLFEVIRHDMERRIADRMAGAVEALQLSGWEAVSVAVKTAFDVACRLDMIRILSEPMDTTANSPIEAMLVSLSIDAPTSTAHLLAELLRTALASIENNGDDNQQQIRDGLLWIFGQR
jgi:AcrR family transcriptional regulator